MRRRQRAAYVEHVVTVLADEFEWDDTTRDICRRSLSDVLLVRGSLGFPAWFEFICDDPISANWRLKREIRDRWGLRVAYYGYSDKGYVHADELTARLIA